VSALNRVEPAAASNDGLKQVYLLHRPGLLRFLRARGAGEEADDLLQDMWLKLSSASTGPVNDPLAYLYRAANNLMLDRRRSAARQAKREQEYSGVIPGSDPPDDRPDGERVLVAREELHAAEAALASLGERTGTIFRRFRLKGQSQREIAGELGISLSAVEKHLQKAYRSLLELKRRGDAG
jgi:RNA polymerase sigma-70 factor (ECF subfamily)